MKEDADILRDWNCGDSHVHSYYSSGSFLNYDCPYSPELMLNVAAKKGLRWIAPTEHNTIDYVKKWEEAGEKYDITILPGIEKSFSSGKKFWFWKGQIHVIVLGIQEKPPKNTVDDLEEFCWWAHDKGYFVVSPHPFNLAGMKERAAKEYVDAIEVRNSMTNFFANLRAERLCKKANKIPIVGSDSHMPETLGCAKVCVDVPEDAGPDDIFQALTKGKVKNVYESYRDIFLVYRLLRKRYELNYDRAFNLIKNRKSAVERAVGLRFLQYGLDDNIKAKLIYLSVRSAWNLADTVRSFLGFLGDF